MIARHHARRICAALAAILVPLSLAHAEAPVPISLVDDAFIDDVRTFLAKDIVTVSVSDQNETKGDLDQGEIDALDARWRAERKADDQPIVAMTLSNPLSNYLTRVQAHSTGLFTEIIVFDRLGLNVGQSAVTSDFWQGDEAKYTRTVPLGPDAVFVDEPEYHKRTGTWRAQLNLTIADPTTNAAIGAATFEINLTELARRTNQ